MSSTKVRELLQRVLKSPLVMRNWDTVQACFFPCRAYARSCVHNTVQIQRGMELQNIAYLALLIRKQVINIDKLSHMSTPESPATILTGVADTIIQACFLQIESVLHLTCHKHWSIL